MNVKIVLNLFKTRLNAYEQTTAHDKLHMNILARYDGGVCSRQEVQLVLVPRSPMHSR